MFFNQREICFVSILLLLLIVKVQCGSSEVCGKICSCRNVDSTEDIIVQCRHPNVLTDVPDLKDEKKMLRVKEL